LDLHRDPRGPNSNIGNWNLYDDWNESRHVACVLMGLFPPYRCWKLTKDRVTLGRSGQENVDWRVKVQYYVAGGSRKKGEPWSGNEAKQRGLPHGPSYYGPSRCLMLGRTRYLTICTGPLQLGLVHSTVQCSCLNWFKSEDTYISIGSIPWFMAEAT